MEQLFLFDDLPAKPRRPLYYERDVVFFGIRLPELGPQAAAVLQRLRRSYRLTGRPYEPHRLHISLLRVGDRDHLTDEMIARLARVVGTVTVAPFIVTFETLLSFDGHARPSEKPAIVLPVAEGAADIIALARDIEASMPRDIIIEGQAPPCPHMTLLRDRVRVPPTPLDRPFGTRVAGFELICSHRRERRYSTLWP